MTRGRDATMCATRAQACRYLCI